MLSGIGGIIGETRRLGVDRPCKTRHWRPTQLQNVVFTAFPLVGFLHFVRLRGHRLASDGRFFD